MFNLTRQNIKLSLFRSAVKYNKISQMKNLWRYWIHLFIATKKIHYSLLSVRFLWILESLHPSVAAVFEQYNVFSFSGNDGTRIAADGMVELVSKNINIQRTIKQFDQPKSTWIDARSTRVFN